jgi:multidrug resistance efflux pump
MNEDQVIGSIHALQWVLKNTSPNKHDRDKIYREIDGLQARLKAMQARTQQRSKQAIPVVPEPTTEELAKREALAQKRAQLERMVEEAKAKLKELDAPPKDEQLKSSKPVPLAFETWTYSEPTEPAYVSDMPMLPHFKGREE